MLNKQNAQTFIHRLTQLKKFDKASTAGLWLVFAATLFELFRSGNASIREVVPFQATMVLMMACVCVHLYFTGRAFVFQAKLTCPKCDDRFFGKARRLIPLNRRSRCQNCKLELGELEKAAEMKLPIASY